jgi:uncharacterized protein (DUF983 family)
MYKCPYYLNISNFDSTAIMVSIINFADTKIDYMSDLLRKIQREKCPTCGEGDVFNSKGNVFLFKMPQMKKKCTSCGYTFEKEPGYFTGAMYVSYGLSIIEMVIIALLLQLTPISTDYLIYGICLTVIVFWPFNFRMSRIIWMYLA